MSLEGTGYRGWSEGLASPWKVCWPMARTGLLLVLRRKLFWLLLAFSLLNFLFLFALIYLKAQLSAQNPGIAGFVDSILTSVTGTGDTYNDFMFAQGTVTMLMLAFAGEMLIGNDFLQGGLTFYLSRRMQPKHYVVGKLLSIGLLVSITTTIPALVLFFEYGLLTDSLTYFRENWRILCGILGYGAILSITLSLLLFALSAWLQKTVPLVMSWAALFVMLPALGAILRRVYDDRHWMLIMLWRDLRLLGRWCFGALEPGEETEMAGSAAVIVLCVCVAATIALVPRVRAVRVVK